MFRLEFASRLAAPRAQVWQRVSTMDGVNAELGPWVRMTFPDSLASLENAPPGLMGKVAFQSWLLFLGVLVMDRHALCLEKLYPGEGFDERSSSWLQEVWVHQRRLRDIPGGTQVTDMLEVTPRIGFAAPLVKLIVSALFRHRHRQLRIQFGALDG